MGASTDKLIRIPGVSIIGVLLTLLLGAGGTWLWIRCDKADTQRQAYASSLNGDEDARGYFSAQGSTLHIELSERDADAVTTDVVADGFIQGDYIRKLQNMGFNRVEITGRDESTKAVRAIR
jgi:hypothetical protein